MLISHILSKWMFWEIKRESEPSTGHNGKGARQTRDDQVKDLRWQLEEKSFIELLPPGKGAGTATGFGKMVTKACEARTRTLNMFTMLVTFTSVVCTCLVLWRCTLLSTQLSTDEPGSARWWAGGSGRDCGRVGGPGTVSLISSHYTPITEYHTHTPLSLLSLLSTKRVLTSPPISRQQPAIIRHGRSKHSIQLVLISEFLMRLLSSLN